MKTLIAQLLFLVLTIVLAIVLASITTQAASLEGEIAQPLVIPRSIDLRPTTSWDWVGLRAVMKPLHHIDYIFPLFLRSMLGSQPAKAAEGFQYSEADKKRWADLTAGAAGRPPVDHSKKPVTSLIQPKGDNWFCKTQGSQGNMICGVGVSGSEAVARLQALNHAKLEFQTMNPGVTSYRMVDHRMECLRDAGGFKCYRAVEFQD